jgi:transposase
MVEADAPQVRCREHGPTVAAVPWARHGAGHTYAFDQQVAWLAIPVLQDRDHRTDAVAWRTVGAIITRVWADVEAVHDRFANLSRIGLDEIATNASSGT